MKILLATNVRPVQGGVGTYLNSLADGFEQSGHEVHVLSVFGLARRFRAVSPGVMGSLGALLQNDLSAAIIYRATQAVMFLRAVASIKEGQYDIVHCHDVSALNALAPLTRRVPLFLTIHGLLSKEALDRKHFDSEGLLVRLFHDEERKAFNRASAVFAITPAFGQYIRDLAPDAHVIPTTGLIDWHRWRGNAKSASQDAGLFRIAVIARLVEVKGVAYAIKALQHLPSNVVLDVIGDGPDRASLSELAQSMSLGERVAFHGLVPYSQIIDRYLDADVIVVPSVTLHDRQDNAPLAVLEAISAGRPVVGTDAIGSSEVKELVSAGGLVVPERSPEDIARAVNALMNDKCFYEQKVKNGFTALEARFSTKIVVEKTIHSYRQIGSPQPHA